MLSQTNPDCKALRWSVPCRSPAHQTKEIASVFAPRLAVNRADGADERLALLRCQLQALDFFHPGGGHRIVLFLNVQLAWEVDRVLVGRRANWPQAIGEMSESGLEVPEDAAVHPRFELCGQHLPEAPVDRGTRSLDVGKQEREIGHPEVRHALAEIAARLVSKRQHAL